MDIAELIVRSIIFVIVLYAGWLCIRIVRALFRWTLNLGRSAQELPRRAGAATAVAVDAARTVKDSFVDGYRTKR